MKLNAGSGRDYRVGWTNVDIDGNWSTDVIADLSSCMLPKELMYTRFDEIFAGDLLEHVSDLVQLMNNFLILLKDGGILEVHVPYDLSLGAWQDPTHVRAFNENSWKYYTEWWWYLGWTIYRFELESVWYSYSALGIAMAAKGRTLEELLRTPRAIDSMSVRLRKVLISKEEKEEAKKWIVKKDTQ